VTLALQVRRSPLRWAAARTLGGQLPRVVTGAASSMRLATVDTPVVEHAGWGLVEPVLSGICGSDLAMLAGTTAFYFSGLVSFPFTPGHEVLGVLRTDCGELAAGTRVVLDPVLGDAPRGLARDPDRPSNTADSITTGDLAPGLQTGFCASTGTPVSCTRCRTTCPTTVPSSPSPSPARCTRRCGRGSLTAPRCWSSAPGLSGCC